MIYVVIGTKAQLIKMAPVMMAMQRESLEYRFIWTGQHRDTTQEILKNFGIRGPDETLYEGPDITSIGAMFRWSMGILWRFSRKRKTLFDLASPGIVLVHGDTFSTLLGALMGRACGLSVGHVESGLRSFNLWHPFPEEITRLITFRLATTYFCPDRTAIQNLDRYKGEKVDTQGNTLMDALRVALEHGCSPSPNKPGHPYGVVTLHRFENLNSRRAVERVVELVELVAEQVPLLFILHKPTEKALIRHELLSRLENNEKIELRPRYDYFNFINLVLDSEFVVSDGGSNQEECSYMGKPILLLRRATERNEGLGANCVLSNYDVAVVSHFAENYRGFTAEPVTSRQSPSAIIAHHCKQYVVDAET